ncbi:MAG: sulfotransferase [Cyanobacteriota bacterium]|nr:sulfotransferase [Cyanobacteriota bacterium]
MSLLKMLTKPQKLLKLTEDLLNGIPASQKPPIYLAGLPRSGTTWIGSVLNTSPGIKYCFEPFNEKLIPEAVPHRQKHLNRDDWDEEFARYCRDALGGRINTPYIRLQLNWIYKKIPWFPGRVLVKDVNSLLVLEWLDRHISQTIVIIMRHPCAVASSWFRLWKGPQKELEFLLNTLLKQPKLMKNYLHPFEQEIKTARGFWQKMGAFWGAMYYVALQQQNQHPKWLVVQHEQFCHNPSRAYRQLFERLDLPWSARTDDLLDASTYKNSKNPFVTRRISSQEPDKWKQELEPWQIEEVKTFVRPFSIQDYPDLFERV